MGLKAISRTTSIIFSIFFSLPILGEAASKKWVHPFTPLRQLYVSPSGNGSGSQSNPMSLSTALNTALPGDLYWVTAGTYSGLKTLHRNGTADKPIVFRAVPGHHVVINGGVDIAGHYNWIWGFDITDPTPVAPEDSGVRLLSTGAHVINNVIHHHNNKNGIGAWQNGPGHVIYGNIVFANGHNIYMQNDFAQTGYKYVVGNMFIDAALVQEDGRFNVHGYTTNGMVTGFYVQYNIVSQGDFLLGGYGLPADREIVKKNYFYNSQAFLGWRRPSQAKFKKNYLGRSNLRVQWFWGEGEVLYKQNKPNQIVKNEIYLPPNSRHILFTTSAYLPEGRCEGCPAIRGGDTFDFNKYSAPFRASFFADNANLGDVNMTEWRNATAQAGKAFDEESNEVAVPTVNKVVLLRNEYDPKRAHLAIYNWQGLNSVTVNLGSLANNGDTVKVLNPRNVWGSPVFSGTYNGSISIPTGGAEYKNFLVEVQ